MIYDIVAVIQAENNPPMDKDARGEFAAGLCAHIADYFEERGISPKALDVVLADAHVEMKDGQVVSAMGA